MASYSISLCLSSAKTPVGIKKRIDAISKRIFESSFFYM